MTTIQAFGTTEKRFTDKEKQEPGPGTYKSERHGKMAANYAVKRIGGQLVKMKKSKKQSASFVSTTNRFIENELNHAAKLDYPGMAKYKSNKWDTIG